jgi:FtsZ-interacting cell division protein ZipA
MAVDHAPTAIRFSGRKKTGPKAGSYFDGSRIILPEQQQPKQRQQQPKQPKRQPKQPKRQRQQQPAMPVRLRRQQELRPVRLRRQPEQPERWFQQPELQERLLLSSSKQPGPQPAGKRSAEIFSWFFP